MLEAIYTGNELGSGGGGGGSTNPTSGVMPVNIFGTFADSLIQSTTVNAGTTNIRLDDINEEAEISAGALSSILIDGPNNRIDITAADVNVYNDFNINGHLGLALLRFLGSGSARPAIKAVGNALVIRLADDSAETTLRASVLYGSQSVNSFNGFIFDGTGATRGSIQAYVDGIFTLLNNAGNNFKSLQFGGTTAAFSQISLISTGLAIRKADNSGDADLTALNLIASGKVTTALDFSVNLRSVLTSLVDSNFTLYNAAKTNFNILQFGGITSAFPGLKRSAAILQARLADDSAFTDLQANNLITESGNLQSNNTALQLRVSGTTTIFRGTANGVQIANGATTPNASAQLEVVSTSRGFLPPKMTNAQRTAIASPAVGLMVYCTDTTEGLYIYKSTGWTFII